MDESISAHADGATVRLRVVPRAPHTGLAGGHGDALKLRVHAAPIAGAANDEVCRFVASRVDVHRSAVSILRGAHGRDKVVLVRGVSPSDLRQALAEVLP